MRHSVLGNSAVSQVLKLGGRESAEDSQTILKLGLTHVNGAFIGSFYTPSAPISPKFQI